jgi:hypothetical protein
LEEEENKGGEQGDRAVKTAEVSYEEDGGGGGDRTKLAGDERGHVSNQQKESSKGMQLRKKNKGSKNT